MSDRLTIAERHYAVVGNLKSLRIMKEILRQMDPDPRLGITTAEARRLGKILRHAEARIERWMDAGETDE